MRRQQKSWKRKLALKVFVCVGLGFIALIAILALAPSEPIWTTTKRQLEARGEVLDWDKFIPPTVPSKENLFEHPIVASLLPIKGQPAGPNPLNVTLSHPPGTDHLGIPYVMTNLVALPRQSSSNELSLTELKAWFARYDEAFAQLREAGKRPKVRWPGDYSTPLSAPIPNSVAVRNVAQVLVSRANLHLLLGESAAALGDLETLAVVMSSLEAQPGTVVAAMIRVAIAGLYTVTVEEGLRRKLWSEDELKKLIPRLHEIDLLKVVAQGLRGERAGVLRHLTAVAEKTRDPLYKDTVAVLSSDAWTMERFLFKYSPAHWIRRNQADYAMVVQGYLDGISASKGRINLDEVNRVNAEVTKLNSSWKGKVAVFLHVLPNLSKAFSVVAKNQTKADQLAVACALELYWKRNQSYPKELRQLVPEYLPAVSNDIYTGKEMGYARREKGYELLSSTAQITHPSDAGNFVWAGK